MYMGICKRHERPNRLLEINNVKNCARSKWLNDIRYLEIYPKAFYSFVSIFLNKVS